MKQGGIQVIRRSEFLDSVLLHRGYLLRRQNRPKTLEPRLNVFNNVISQDIGIWQIIKAS